MVVEFYNEIKTLLKYAIAGTEWEGHVYTVGGCERDRLMGREIKDIDIVVDLPNGGIRFAKWLEKHNLTEGSVVVYENFGTAMFRLSAKPTVEIEAVQTRKECYRDTSSRNPETAFGTIEDDCHRRDFTYNAIYYDITNEEVKDFNGQGLDDLKANIIRTCGDPDIIYKEDPLRILRAIRFSTRFNSKFEVNTLLGMYTFAHRLEIISKERIQDEVFKILTSDGAKDGLELIFNIGAISYIFPSISNKNKNEILHRAERWSSADCLAVRLASILYEVDITETLKFLKCSNELIENVENFAEWIFRLKGIRELSAKQETYIRKVQLRTKNPTTFEQAARALYIVTGNLDDFNNAIKISTTLQMNGTDMFGFVLPINGEDIMKSMGIGQSREVGRYLEYAYEEAYENPVITKEQLLDNIKDIVL